MIDHFVFIQLGKWRGVEKSHEKAHETVIPVTSNINVPSTSIFNSYAAMRDNQVTWPNSNNNNTVSLNPYNILMQQQLMQAALANAGKMQPSAPANLLQYQQVGNDTEANRAAFMS